MADSRLDNIYTSWTIIGEMQKTLPPERRNQLWEEFLGRYETVIRRYLMAIVRNAETVDELYSQFLQRCVSSIVPRADQAKGRFRDLVKTVLLNLVRNEWGGRAARGKNQVPLADGMDVAGEAPEQ